MYSHVTSQGTVRTSTPNKSLTYDFDPRPSTSSDVNAPTLEIARSSSKLKLRKGSYLALICDAIETVGLPLKGASYMAIQKWIIDKKRSVQPKTLRTFIRRQIYRGLEIGLLKRSIASRTSIGVQGYFIINKNFGSPTQIKLFPSKEVRRDQLALNSSSTNIDRKRNILRTAENIRENTKSIGRPTIKNNATSGINTRSTNRDILESQEDRNMQTVLDSIMEMKHNFENAVQSVIQQASKIQETASKLVEVSNSLSMWIGSETLNSGNQTPCVASIHTPQSGETRSSASMPLHQVRPTPADSSKGGEASTSFPMHFNQGGELRPTPMQGRVVRANPMNMPQSEESRENLMNSVQGLEENIALLRSSLARVMERSSMNTSQAQPREATMHLPPTKLARVAPMNSLPSREAQDSLQGRDEQTTPMLTPHVRLVRLALVQSTEVETHSPLSQDARVALVHSTEGQAPHTTTAMHFSQFREARVALVNSPQSGEMRVSSVESPQGAEAHSLQSQETSIALVNSTQSRETLSPTTSPTEGQAPHTTAMYFSQFREARVVLVNSPQSGEMRVSSVESPQGAKAHSPQSQETSIALVNSTQSQETLSLTMNPTEGQAAHTTAMHFPQSSEATVALGNSPQSVEVRQSPMQTSQNKDARVLPVQAVSNGESRPEQYSSGTEVYLQQDWLNEEISLQHGQNVSSDSSFEMEAVGNGESRPEPYSSGTEVDSQQESLNEEISLQRDQNVSWDSSFEIGAEVSILLKRIDED